MLCSGKLRQREILLSSVSVPTTRTMAAHSRPVTSARQRSGVNLPCRRTGPVFPRLTSWRLPNWIPRASVEDNGGRERRTTVGIQWPQRRRFNSSGHSHGRSAWKTSARNLRTNTFLRQNKILAVDYRSVIPSRLPVCLR